MTNTKSLLRYPGSKARFVDFISKVILINNIRVETFVEPFCGGASVSIGLLEKGLVDRVVLNDMDPLISQLWETVFSSQAEWLAEQIMKIPLTVEEWDKQKKLVPKNKKEAALKCLYINRTSFNGILHRAGPIGGRTQSKRTIGVRFNRDKLSERVIWLSKLKDRIIKVSNNDWGQTCNETRKMKNVLFYFDPPYFHKADILYKYHFLSDGHIRLRKYLSNLKQNWILSYDDAREIRLLYDNGDFCRRVMNNLYSAHPSGGSSMIGRELFFTNMDKLPHSWRSAIGRPALSINNSTESKLNFDSVVRTPVAYFI